MLGTLYLIPTTLGGETLEAVLPIDVIGVAKRLEHFIVEDIRSARRFLAKVQTANPIDSLHFYELNEHTPALEVEKLAVPLLEGKNVGLLSEAGVPAVADPGANLVALAHLKGIPVVPLTGPSSILMAVMASGLSGQNFAFVGYLPIKQGEREQRIRHLEARSRSEGQAQFLIEAPYRNNQLFQSLVGTLMGTTLVSVACDLTLPTQLVATRSVAEWKKEMPDLHKRPSIFGFMYSH